MVPISHRSPNIRRLPYLSTYIFTTPTNDDGGNDFNDHGSRRPWLLQQQLHQRRRRENAHHLYHTFRRTSCGLCVLPCQAVPSRVSAAALALRSTNKAVCVLYDGRCSIHSLAGWNLASGVAVQQRSHTDRKKKGVRDRKKEGKIKRGVLVTLFCS